MKKSQPVNTPKMQEVANLALEYAQVAVFVFDAEGVFLYTNPAGQGDGK